MKRVLSLLFSFVFLALLLPVPARGDDVKYEAYIECEQTVAAVNDEIVVGLYMRSNQTDLSYNSYYFKLNYDAAELEFKAAAIGSGEPDIVEASEGILIIGGYGASRSERGLRLTFTAVGAGDAAVKLEEAYMDLGENAGLRDAPAATIDTAESAVTIRCGGYPVKLPEDEGISGPSFVTEGEDYTFSANIEYAYTFKATVNGIEVEVIDNNNGTYTVKNVNGPLVITRTGAEVRTYSVTITGAGKDDVTGDTAAAHGQPYTFTLQKVKDYVYTVSAAVNDQTVDCIVNGEEYTISGEAIVGPVVITVTKTLAEGKTLIVFEGNGAGDLGSYVRSNDIDFIFPITREEGFEYTVTAVNDNGEILTLAVDEERGMYTISGKDIQGGTITVTITRTEKTAIAVTAAPYVKLKNTTVWLIQAEVEEVDITKGLYYNDSAMFWSPEYSAYAWLVTSVETQDSVKTAAEAAVNIRTKNNTTLVYSGDVNRSGRVDINDAQYIYNVYNNGYAAIDDVEKFLRCDMNRDNQVDTTDVTVVVNKLLNR